MDDNLKEIILEKCAGLDIPLVGFAPAERWDTPYFEPWVPEAFRPRSLFPAAETVIVMGLPVSLPVVESAPSIWYHELYRTVNTLLDEHGYRIATFLTRLGYPSVWVPRDGYGSIGILKEKPVAFFSHRHAAFLAGLGTFGLNNTLLTNEFGPRVRFVSVLTATRIAPDPVLETPVCTRCMRCVEACPASALDGRDYPAGLTDKRSCAVRSEELNARSLSPCGICIQVCPVGKDRAVFDREDMGVFDRHDEHNEPLRRSWEHVRSWGSR